MKKFFLLTTLMLLTVMNAAAQPFQTDTFKTASGKDVIFSCIKHASIRIDYEGRYFYIDPVTALKPATDFTTMPRANCIFITHEHGDHYDRMALAQLSTPHTYIYCNPSVGRLLSNAFSMQNGDSVTIGTDVTLKAVPAYNTTPGREQFHPKGRDNGYVLTIDGLRIYIAGDTEDIPEMAEIKDIDIAFLPCNQPYTMTIDQLVRAAKVIKPRVLFPYHYSDTPVSKVRLELNGTGIDVRIRNYQ